MRPEPRTLQNRGVDLWGFGRRELKMPVSDIEHLVAYQLGALEAIARANGFSVTHVKPHGQLHNMAIVDFDIALAIAKAIKAVDRDLVFVGLNGSELERAAQRTELRFAKEAFADRRYEDDGNLTSRREPDAVIHDTEEAVRQVVTMMTEGVVVARSGKRVPIEVHSICVHGDETTAVPLARAVRDGLERNGVRVVPLPELGL
jgi:UPF0271 protein